LAGGRGVPTKRRARPPAGAATQGMVALTTLDKALWVPALV
jgi:hypothetical protein